MSSLVLKRCFNHSHREAVARCPQCTRYFCRECVTEHDNRVLCAACLAKLSRVPLLRRPAIVGLLHFIAAACGFLFLWFFFYLIGETLLKLPSSFHEGTLWKSNWLD